MVGYIFGADTGKTPEDLKRERAIAAALAQYSAPQNVGEGIGAVMRGLASGVLNYRANKAETAGRQSANTAFSAIERALMGNTANSVNSVNTANNVKATATDTFVEPPKQKPITGTMENARAVDRSSVKEFAAQEPIAAAAEEQAVSNDPLSFAKVVNAGKGWTEVASADGKIIRREGARNWRNNNPGNIEFGNFAKSKGAIGTDGRFAVFPTLEAGRKAKEALLFESPNYREKTIYGAISRWAPPNENDTGAYANSIASALGVPADTPISALNAEQRSIMMDAMQRVEGFRPGREKILKGGEIEAAAQPVVDPKPVEVAQATGQQQSLRDVINPADQFPAAPVADEGVSDAAILQALSNPWATDGQRGAAEYLLKQRLAQKQAEQEMRLKQADPAYQLELEKGRLEVDKLKNPRLSPADEARLQFEREKFMAEQEAKGKIAPADQAKLDFDKEKFEWEKTKPPEDIVKYKFYEQRELDAGRQPLGPLDWEKERRKAGAQTTTVNNNMKTEGEFEKEAAKKQAEFFSNLADEGLNARGDIEIINQLDGFLKGQGGAVTGLSGALSKWGIPFEGADDLQAAEALINKLVPTQRQPGSGTMSDRDVQLFKDSLPSLWNQPGGNEKIIGVMRGMAEYKSRQGEIADMVLNGDLTRQEGRRELRDLPNPLEEFRKAKKEEAAPKEGAAADPVSDAPKVGDIVDGYQFLGGDPADPKSWAITEGAKVQ